MRLDHLLSRVCMEVECPHLLAVEREENSRVSVVLEQLQDNAAAGTG